MSMDKISEAILDKVKAEAQEIISDAEAKAKERVDKAKEQYRVRFEEEKKKLVEEAENEAARIHAQASITAREELLNAKDAIIEEIIRKVKQGLSDVSGGEKLTLDLIREALDASGVEKVRVYVAQKDIAGLERFVKADKELSGKITEIKEYKCDGGAVVEDVNGTVNVDNTYETRLDTLLPRILPEIGKELFGDS